MCGLPNGHKGHMRYYCCTNSRRVHFKKSACHMVKKGCDSHEDPRRPENSNALGKVTVKLLLSTPCSMTILDNLSSLTSNRIESP